VGTNGRQDGKESDVDDPDNRHAPRLNWVRVPETKNSLNPDASRRVPHRP
jgi:hypothetical protein